MNTKLLSHSDKLQTEAENIIESTNLVKILEAIGQVEVIGSMRFKTLYRRDIDLIVLSEDVTHDNAVKVTKQLLATQMFQKVTLEDYQAFPGDDMPAGFYWQLIFMHENTEWKFDIWYMRPDEKYTHMIKDAIDELEDAIRDHHAMRERILEVKEKLYDGSKYKGKTSGIEIYRAVVHGDDNSIQEFIDSHS